MSDHIRAGVRYFVAMLALAGVGLVAFLTWNDARDTAGEGTVRAALNSGLYLERGFYVLCILGAFFVVWVITRAEE